MTEFNRRPFINNKTKLFMIGVGIFFCLIVILSVYFVNEFILSQVNMKIDEWWILALLSMNIIVNVMTEMFRFDDSTGGYKNLLDGFKMSSFIFITIMMIVLKQYNIISITNKDLFVFLLIVHLIMLFIKNVVRNYLSNIHQEKIKLEWGQLQSQKK